MRAQWSGDRDAVSSKANIGKDGSTGGEDIIFEERLIPPDDIPGRRVFADDVPALRAALRNVRMIAAVDGSAADVRGGPPDQLGEMAGLFREAGGKAEVVLVTFVAPGAYGC